MDDEPRVIHVPLDLAVAVIAVGFLIAAMWFLAWAVLP